MDEDQKVQARWYVVHTYSGYENRVEQTIQAMIQNKQVEDFIEEVIVPTEKVVELVKGQKRTTTRKFYPGYALVKMIFNDRSWHIIQSIPKVSGFIGGKGTPTPLSEREVNKILGLIEERQEQPRPKFFFEKGDQVRVVDGPFSNFNGVVEDVNFDKGKIRVSVSIFGRQTPVELDFVQVSKG